MPLQSLLWWSVIGAAWGPMELQPITLRLAGRLGKAVVLVIAMWATVRLASACGDGCDPIVRYGGHPRFVGAPTQVIGADADDPRWTAWRRAYPLAFWLRSAEVRVRAVEDPRALVGLLRAYPFQSAQTYIEASDAFGVDPMVQDIASCGLIRFFDGRPIRRDWRSSPAELDDQRRELQARAGFENGDEEACQRAGIPDVALGRQ